MTTVSNPPDGHYGPALSAVMAGDIDKLTRALESGIDVNADYTVSDKPDDGWESDDESFETRTLLSIAAGKGMLEIVKLLIRKGALVHSEDMGDDMFGNRSPLFAACKGGHMDVVRRLIEAGATVGLYEWGSWFYATYTGPWGMDMIGLFLERGDSPQGFVDELLGLAIRAEHISAIEYLIHRNVSLRLALKSAMEYEVSDSAISLLLSRGAPDKYNVALRRACGRVGRISTVKLLLNHFGPPSAQELEGYGVLEAIFQTDNGPALEQLLLYRGRVLLGYVRLAATKPPRRTGLGRCLIAAGLDVNTRTSIKTSPDFVADEEMRFLCHRSKTIQSAWEPTVDENFFYYSWEFLDHTALHASMPEACPATVRELLDAGAEVDLTTSDGHTPLMLLCWYVDPDHRYHWPYWEAGISRTECLVLLLDAGADPKRRDKFGHTAADLLRRVARPLPEAAKMLEILENRQHDPPDAIMYD